jgi:adenosine kinase
MIDHASQFVEAGIPFVFDPGQGLPMFDGDDLKTFIEQATWMTVNDYESQLVQERTGMSEAEIAAQVDAYIVTKGGEGSVIYADGEIITIPTVDVSEIKDPTGCGDAYRAGLLYGLLYDLDWKTTGQIASLMGGIKIEHEGTQNHGCDRQVIMNRYHQAYGEELKIDGTGIISSYSM